MASVRHIRDFARAWAEQNRKRVKDFNSQDIEYISRVWRMPPQEVKCVLGLAPGAAQLI